MIEITEVNLKKLEGMGRVKGIASITIDDCFVINDIKIAQNQKGLFVMMPNKRTPNGDFKDIAHPIKQETRERIQNAILKKYKEM